jgi:hypothetical protein
MDGDRRIRMASKDLHEYLDTKPNEEDLDEIFLGIRSHGPRGIAMIIARDLEEYLIGALQRCCGIQAPRRSTFSDKIRLAYDNGVVGPKTKHDLEVIREIRNAMAHARRQISFETPVIADLCSKLNALKGFEGDCHSGQDNFIFASTRVAFLIAHKCTGHRTEFKHLD